MIAPQQGQLPPNFDIKKTTALVCEECKGEAFIEALHLRKISALLTKTGKEGFLPITVFACVKCGHVNSNFLPSEIRPVSLVQP